MNQYKEIKNQNVKNVNKYYLIEIIYYIYNNKNIFQ